jgi:excisionase family DNA binding protein
MDTCKLTYADIAAKIKVDKRTIRRWSRDGRMPAPVTTGPKRLRFSAVEIDAWLAAGCPRRDEETTK